MGLLSFRRKSKVRSKEVEGSKHSVPELTFEQSLSNNESDSSESQVSFHSPIADSFMMASSIPDITANNLLDEILNELPKQEKNNYRVANDKDTASDDNFSDPPNFVDSPRRDVNKLSDAGFYSAETQSYATIIENNNYRNSTENDHRIKALDHTFDAKNTLEERNFNYKDTNTDKSFSHNERIDCSTNKYSQSDSSSSISSLSSTEELIPLHHISRSDPNYNKSSTTFRNSENLPLIDLIPQSKDLKSAKNLNHNANVEDSFNQISATISNTSTIPRSPGFVIDRMKERHRQECRRSLQWSPAMANMKVTQPVRRASSLMTSGHIQGNAALQRQRQKYFQGSNQDRMSTSHPNQRMTIVSTPSHTTSSLLITDMVPVKSYSTLTNRQYKGPLLSTAASEVQARQHSRMKPIQEVSPTLETSSKAKYIRPIHAVPHCQKYSVVEGGKNKNEITWPGNSVSDPSERVGCGGKGIHTKTHDGYTSLKCHAKQVTQLHHISSIVSQQKNDKPGSLRPNPVQNNTASIINTLPNNSKSPANLDNLLENCMDMNSKLKAEYRRMRIIHKTRSYSVPDLTQLLDNKEEELDDTQRRKSVEKSVINTAYKSVEPEPKGSALEEEEHSTVQTKKEPNYPNKARCCHKVHNDRHNCHHHEVAIHRKHLPSCCRYVYHAEPVCCNHSRHCKPVSQKAAASTKTKTPPEKSILITSPSASQQPHVVQNVKYDKVKIDGKSLYHCNLYRPICQNCRH